MHTSATLLQTLHIMFTAERLLTKMRPDSCDCSDRVAASDLATHSIMCGPRNMHEGCMCMCLHYYPLYAHSSQLTDLLYCLQIPAFSCIIYVT